MRSHRFTTFLGLATIACFGGLANAQQLLVNGDFEQMPNWNNGLGGDGSYTFFTGTSIPGWTIATNHAATVHNTNTYPFISGTYSVNTDGEGWNGNNIDMWQDFNTVSGVQYTLSFDWKGWVNSTNTLDVRIHNPADTNDWVVDEQRDWVNDGGAVHNVTQTFTGTGSPMRLHIFHNPANGVNDNTFILDNFSVTAPVPEPASMAALSLGLIGLLRKKMRS